MRHRITVRLTSEELELFREKAKKKNMTISDLVRTSVLSEKHARRKSFECEYVKKIYYELNKIGTNINQIAKRCNTQREIDLAVLEELAEIEDYLSLIAEACKNADKLSDIQK